MTPDPEVEDDPRLLRLMLDDLAAADPIFQPTHYWKNYERRFVPYLAREGIAGFRGRPEYGAASVLASFGALDAVQGALSYRRLDRFAGFDLPGLRRIFSARARARLQAGWEGLARRLALRETPTLEQWRMLCFAYASAVGRSAGAAPLEGLRVSMAGSPADRFELEGGLYTSLTLYYYLRYAFVAAHLDLSRVGLVVELGSGSGKQAELLARLHPNLSVCLFDLPPQLYVAHQFLRAALPGRVSAYHETRSLTRLPALAPGRIHLFGSWQLPLIARERVDLFWSCATFGEMEPDVAANYLKYVNESAANVYLMQRMGGKKIAKRVGRRGVLRQTTLDDYRAGLPRFELADRAPARAGNARPLPGYEDSFWRRSAT